MGMTAIYAVATAASAYGAYDAHKRGVEAQEQQAQAAAQAEASKPQATKAPDANSVSGQLAGTGQAGGAPGIAQTFLTGASGVDPTTLNLGKSTLLGS
jgi:hypothetical protein